MTDYISLDLLESIINDFILQNKTLCEDINIRKETYCVYVSEKGKKTNYQFQTNGLIKIEKYHQYEGYLFEECEKLELLINELIENRYIIEYNCKYWFVNMLIPEMWVWINILKEENILLQDELNELRKGLKRL